jgi:hypothetical protein
MFEEQAYRRVRTVTLDEGPTEGVEEEEHDAPSGRHPRKADVGQGVLRSGTAKKSFDAPRKPREAEAPMEGGHKRAARGGLDGGARLLDKQGSLAFSVPSAGYRRPEMSGSVVWRTHQFSGRGGGTGKELRQALMPPRPL